MKKIFGKIKLRRVLLLLAVMGTLPVAGFLVTRSGERDLVGDVVVSISKTFPRHSTGFKADSLESHLNETLVRLPDVLKPGHNTIMVQTKFGNLAAGVYVKSWHGPEFPTIVHHHGTMEQPYEWRFSTMFNAEDSRRFNLIAVKTVYHERFFHYFLAASDDLDKITATHAASIEIIQAVLQHASFKESPLTVVTGYSMGGFVTLLHHVFYNSADLYFPFGAGLDFAHLALEVIPADPAALANPKDWIRNFDLTDRWKTLNHENVFPVMALRDAFFHFEVQRPLFGDIEVEVWDTGHTVGALQLSRIRDFIVSRTDGVREKSGRE